MPRRVVARALHKDDEPLFRTLQFFFGPGSLLRERGKAYIVARRGDGRTKREETIAARGDSIS
jgi:hypothetical protein